MVNSDNGRDTNRCNQNYDAEICITRFIMKLFVCLNINKNPEDE